MSRDIDQIIEKVMQRIPGADVMQHYVKNPAIDDDGVWNFAVSDPRTGENDGKSIQIESSFGKCPFLLEHSDMKSSHEAERAYTVEEAVEKICEYLTGPKNRNS